MTNGNSAGVVPVNGQDLTREVLADTAAFDRWCAWQSWATHREQYRRLTLANDALAEEVERLRGDAPTRIQAAPCPAGLVGCVVCERGGFCGA